MAYLQITLDISEKNRAAAAAVYQKYKALRDPLIISPKRNHV
ncbi:hypothetical protein [Klebsiella pneumoniae]|nr:hypothetical protein [Klebsiella pneumoniae]MEC4551285.1 hypothetical protein [Klebsiella pneumoniae]